MVEPQRAVWRGRRCGASGIANNKGSLRFRVNESRQTRLRSRFTPTSRRFLTVPLRSLRLRVLCVIRSAAYPSTCDRCSGSSTSAMLRSLGNGSRRERREVSGRGRQFSGSCVPRTHTETSTASPPMHADIPAALGPGVAHTKARSVTARSPRRTPGAF